jgi:catechol 2,3-dioxygenase-like lactoylglutathione lyase family enzyme
MDAARPVLSGIVLGAPDPQALASFYERLLGYERIEDSPEWVVTRPPGGARPGLSFLREEHHSPPTWPAGPVDQQMQVHLDLLVTDLQAACTDALAAGAVLAELQPQDHVRVCLDPAGHPFFLYVETD